MQLGGLVLPDNFHWRNEFGWTPTLRETATTLTGAVIVDVWNRQGGRPITLAGLWLTRAELVALTDLEADPASEPMTLTLPDGREFEVLWRQDGDEPAVAAEPLRDASPEAVGDEFIYSVEIRLQTA